MLAPYRLSTDLDDVERTAVLQRVTLPHIEQAYRVSKPWHKLHLVLETLKLAARIVTRIFMVRELALISLRINDICISRYPGRSFPVGAASYIPRNFINNIFCFLGRLAPRSDWKKRGSS